MFNSLLFLVFNLLLFANAQDQSSWPYFSHDPFLAFAAALAGYGIILIFLYLQNRIFLKRRRTAETIMFINNLELLGYFFIYYFLIGAQRIPETAFAPFGQSASLVCSLALYFYGLFICQLPMQRKYHHTLPGIIPARFLIPFTLPFLLFIVLSEGESLIDIAPLANILGFSHPATLQIIILLLINLIALSLAIVFLPPLTVIIWGCDTLNKSPLTDELNTLCKRAGFKHAGLKVWNVLEKACTAAVIGVTGRFRYVLFTKKLLSSLSDNAIKAVVAHEIGHSKKYHLLIYPFVLLGMAVVGSLALFPLYFLTPPANNGDVPSLWQVGGQFLSFVIFCAVIALYFRYVFGYFSRCFERQADLYIFEVGIPAKDMVEALDTLAVVSGNIHTMPNWHHYSIKERIDFLQQAEQNPKLISQHNRRVSLSLIVYGLIVMPLLAFLIFEIVRMN